MRKLLMKAWAWIILPFIVKQKTLKDEPLKEKCSEKKLFTKRPDEIWTLPSLLENLEKEHKRFTFKRSKYSSIGKKEWKALRFMGTFVTKRRVVPVTKDPEAIYTFLIGMKAPPMVSVGFFDEKGIVKKEGQKGDWHHSGLFAIKQPRKPLTLMENTPGVRYELGLSVCYYDGEELSVTGMITVDFKTGRIYIPKMYHKETLVTPQHQCYTRPSFAVPNAAFFADEQRDHWRKEAEASIRNLAASAFNTWKEKEQSYQISTKKKGNRVTFCVDEGEHIKFFKDRDKTVEAKDGKRKRILHHVAKHTRLLKTGKISVVSEHLRGIKRFIWKGYEISISVPGFHTMTHAFDLDPVDLGVTPKADTVSLFKVVKKLVVKEDYGKYRHGDFG